MLSATIDPICLKDCGATSSVNNSSPHGASRSSRQKNRIDCTGNAKKSGWLENQADTPNNKRSSRTILNLGFQCEFEGNRYPRLKAFARRHAATVDDISAENEEPSGFRNDRIEWLTIVVAED